MHIAEVLLLGIETVFTGGEFQLMSLRRRIALETQMNGQSIIFYKETVILFSQLIVIQYLLHPLSIAEQHTPSQAYDLAIGLVLGVKQLGYGAIPPREGRAVNGAKGVGADKILTVEFDLIDLRVGLIEIIAIADSTLLFLPAFTFVEAADINLCAGDFHLLPFCAAEHYHFRFAVAAIDGADCFTINALVDDYLCPRLCQRHSLSNSQEGILLAAVTGERAGLLTDMEDGLILSVILPQIVDFSVRQNIFGINHSLSPFVFYHFITHYFFVYTPT